MQDLHQCDLSDAWIEHNPLGLLALDEADNVAWVNQTLLDLLDATPKELLDREQPLGGSLDALFQPDELIKLTRGGRALHLRRHERAMRAPDGTPLRMLCFEDLREVDILQREIAGLRETIAAQAIDDELTGLPNQRAFRQLLDNQVTRSRRYNNPLSVMAVRLQPQNRDTALIADLPEGAILAAAQCLRDRLRWADSIGRWDDNTFLIALPETGIGDAGTLIDKIERGLIASQALINQQFPVRVRFGLAEWQTRVDARGLLDEVLQAVESSDLTLSLTG